MKLTTNQELLDFCELKNNPLEKIKKGEIDLASTTPNGSNLLHWFCYTSNLEVVTYLVEELNFDVKSLNSYGSSTLDFVDQSLNRDNKAQLFKYLADKGANFEIKKKDGGNWLHIAIENNFTLEEIQLLQTKSSDFEEKNNDGDTPLHLAIKRETDIAKIKYLGEQSVDLNQENSKQMTPLELVLASTREISYKEELINYLLEKGANINKKNQAGDNLLHKTSGLVNKFEEIKCLISKGINLEEKNNNSETPLMLATYKAPAEVIKYLVEQGADVNIKSSRQETGDLFPIITSPLFQLWLSDKLDDLGLSSLLPSLSTDQNMPEILSRIRVDSKFIDHKAKIFDLLQKNLPILLNNKAIVTVLTYAANKGADICVWDKEYSKQGGGFYCKIDPGTKIALFLDINTLPEGGIESTLGTLVHELVHFSMNKYYKNQTNPYEEDNELAKTKWNGLSNKYIEKPKEIFNSIKEKGYKSNSYHLELIAYYFSMFVKKCFHSEYSFSPPQDLKEAVLESLQGINNQLTLNDVMPIELEINGEVVNLLEEMQN